MTPEEYERKLAEQQKMIDALAKLLDQTASSLAGYLNKRDGVFDTDGRQTAFLGMAAARSVLGLPVDLQFLHMPPTVAMIVGKELE